MMLNSGGLKRVLLLHGETPTRYADNTYRAVLLLFGAAGSATAIEKHDRPDTPPWHFACALTGAATTTSSFQPEASAAEISAWSRRDPDGAWRKNLSDFASAAMNSYRYNTRPACGMLMLAEASASRCQLDHQVLRRLADDGG